MLLNEADALLGPQLCNSLVHWPKMPRFEAVKTDFPVMS